jgi:UDP:flavonoid glycosyltransferase YjiC (YdhE family)
MVFPLLIDQFYWAHRAYTLGCGPEGLRIKNIKKSVLEQRTVDLMETDTYKQNAAALSGKVKAENGIEAFCDYIERVGAASAGTQRAVGTQLEAL